MSVFVSLNKTTTMLTKALNLKIAVHCKHGSHYIVTDNKTCEWTSTHKYCKRINPVYGNTCIPKRTTPCYYTTELNCIFCFCHWVIWRSSKNLPWDTTLYIATLNIFRSTDSNHVQYMCYILCIISKRRVGWFEWITSRVQRKCQHQSGIKTIPTGFDSDIVLIPFWCWHILRCLQGWQR